MTTPTTQAKSEDSKTLVVFGIIFVLMALLGIYFVLSPGKGDAQAKLRADTQDLEVTCNDIQFNLITRTVDIQIVNKGNRIHHGIKIELWGYNQSGKRVRQYNFEYPNRLIGQEIAHWPFSLDIRDVRCSCKIVGSSPE